MNAGSFEEKSNVKIYSYKNKKIWFLIFDKRKSLVQIYQGKLSAIGKLQIAININTQN